ncbi:hypothetical protein ACIQ2D_11795 [Lysinibacillus sp. NPDC097287]|uniref:hypothetical protein n=1 Tax=Lysinibacillus sp. NPDC097287 TaxID=3364144 RepID=UPI003824A390
MEDPKLYSAQEIEKLKQKIATYRETLTTLKKETSIEDYLLIKSEFDKFKKQVSHLDGLTKTMDVKKNMHIGEYEEQVKQISNQIDFLNQTVEEINQEILLILKKIITNEDNELTDNKIAPAGHRNFSKNDTNSKTMREATTHNQISITNTQPSFKLLQSLAGKAIEIQNIGKPTPGLETQAPPPEARHFNQQYFQLTGTHPSQIYNGLYKNTTMESTLQFKNATVIQEAPASASENSTDNSPPIEEEPVDTHISDTAEADLSEEIVLPAEKIIEAQYTPPIEELSDQVESPKEVTDDKTKKEQNSLFFNIFRRRK